MKAWVISDTHNKHMFLEVPEVDLVICSGDMSNAKAPAQNEHEVLNFIEWYKILPIKYKILVAGNHDTSLEAGLVKRGDIHESIFYLEHESISIEGRNFFGSPYTPKFGTNWAFNVPRRSIKKYWDEIPNNLDVLITHGPPKGILDLTQYDSRAGATGDGYFQCGCKDLLDTVWEKKPKYHVFGHIHQESNCPNSGILKIQNCSTTFVNASVCDYGGRSIDVPKNKEIVNNGFIIDL